MPIIGPALNYHLCKQRYDTRAKDNDLPEFFIRYLLISSQNIYQNSQTLDMSIRFKNLLKNNISLINATFRCNLTKRDFGDPTITDYYKYLYDIISDKYKNIINNYGFYKKITASKGLEMNFYQPLLPNGAIRTWYIGTTPVAVLSICLDDMVDWLEIKFKKFFPIVKFETNLMIASGYSVVLCIELDILNSDCLKFIDDIILSYPYSEIYLNLYKHQKSSQTSIPFKFFKKLFDNYSKIQGYVYLITGSVFKENSKASEILGKLKRKPRFQSIFLAANVAKAMKSMIVEQMSPFVYCRNGFDQQYISIHLCNVPLYENDDEENDNFPSQTSGVSLCYVSPDDFLNWKPQRVKVTFQDETKENLKSEFYVDFDDIHLIRPDMYVESTLYLTKTDGKVLKTVMDLTSKITKKVDTQKDIKKEIILSFQKNKTILNGLDFVASTYSKFASQTIKNFKIHNNQLLTAYEAIQNCLSQDENKGTIYQVETGEGKSCIILIISAVLALMNKTVHIASSNINLANRDYYNSYQFFKQLGLTSSVLLHYNELPFSDFMEDSASYDKKFFPKEFFDESLFQNSLNMNFSVCGIKDEKEASTNKANIIFSTFVNFECFYLKAMEMYPGYIPKYFQKCSLLVDEADSILIDELSNGTILSQEVKSNAREILIYVYKSRIQNASADKVLEYIKKNWPKCNDITIDDVNEMYREIDLVNQDEFVDGKKYSIETFEIKNKTNILELLEKVKNKITDKAVKIFKKKSNEDDDEEEEEEEETKNEHPKTYKEIIPFDYDHKGILEPNKEFSGFIQQFIAIKEMFNNKENSNILIRDISMNYLYISHPIFVNLYSHVCGLTGTIGGKDDKDLFLNQYKLTTKKIPRENPNFRIDLPFILCKDIEERNNKIVSEILNINQKGNPVLVIFQDLNEISTVLFMLISTGITNINVFDGKDEKIKPDFIAGLKGSVSLGTNFCGRGTDITNPSLPLHIIIAYYSSNKRVIDQAFGRTARQGQKGTVRIICLEDDFYSPNEKYVNDEMNDFLDDIQFKNVMQMKFIDKFRKSREWIFGGEIKSQKLPDDVIEKIRKSLININRIKVCNYEYPICMSTKTFLSIQAQKIFSLYNCPNCKYTWMLFQKYVREMIFESWSLLIEKSEKNFFKKERDISYQKYLNLKMQKLIKLLEEYLPESNNPSNYEIIPTFMNIYDKIIEKYEKNVMKMIPDKYTKIFKQAGKKKFCSFLFGFKPFLLIDGSGAKINTIDGSDQDQNYIMDPELKYMKKQPSTHPILLSITERIDGVFNSICNKINEIIGCYIGLRFFLRRTLGGCEFGLCFDFNLEHSEKLENFNCLVDQDPLLMFTITVKSLMPILAGILIIGLVYIASISENIFEWISAFPVKITSKIIKKTIVEISKNILSSQIEKVCDAVCSFLLKILKKQIAVMEKFEPKIVDIFNIMMKIAVPKDFSNIGDQINGLFGGKTNIKINFDLADTLPIGNLLKIGFILMLCFSSFMMNFHFHRKSLKYSVTKVAAKYDKDQNPDAALKDNKKVVEKNKPEKIEKINF